MLAAVEGDADEAVLSRLAERAGLILGTIYGRKGKGYLRDRIKQYNHAAQHYPWVVLVDLDTDADCAPELKGSWLPSVVPQMCFRVAVRAVESWLLADREKFSRFLGVPLSHVPQDTDALPDPKATVISLAQRSGRPAIREDMVPRSGGGRREGPLYTARLIEFVHDTSSGWRPDVAASRSDSLLRCCRALDNLVRDLTAS